LNVGRKRGVRAMNPRVKDVQPDKDYTLKLLFDNCEERIFDVKPYLDRGIFSQLKDLELFHSVKPCLGSISMGEWSGFMP